MATLTTNEYRLEIRQGRMGWRYHVRGPQGIILTAPLPLATRDEALEEGRAQLQDAGVTSWDEWLDGETNNFLDPRTAQLPSVDAVKEARAAGLEPMSEEARAEATAKLRELEARREAKVLEATTQREALPADAGMGVEGGPAEPTKTDSASPVKAQRSRVAKAQATDKE